MSESEYIDCREGCGACCIALDISSSIPGMEGGKPAGMRCIHLTGDFRCALYGNPERPAVCSAFRAERAFCGHTREEAMKILSSLTDAKNRY